MKKLGHDVRNGLEKLGISISISINVNMNSMDFLDVRFNLADNTNTNQTIFQFHTSSNYPKSVLKAIGDGVNKFLISACPPVR